VRATLELGAPEIEILYYPRVLSVDVGVRFKKLSCEIDENALAMISDASAF